MAGKARKSREREQRKKLKRARRETNNAKYAAMRDSGQNKKSKRFILRGKRTKQSHTKHLHLISNCGNIGCKKCFPRPDKPHVVIQKEKRGLKDAIAGKLGTLKELQKTIKHRTLL